MAEKSSKINDFRRKILCIITQGEEGGAQRFVAQLAQHIDHDRFNLRVVWGSDSEASLARHLPEQVSFGIAHNLVRPMHLWKDLRAIRELRAMMREFRPDVVLCISSKAGFVGARAAHGFRREQPNLKVIYRIGGWAFHDPLPAWKRWFYKLLERLSARWKDVIVVNNTHDLDQAHTIGIRPRQRIVRIYNGINPYLPLLSKEEAREYMNGKIPEPYGHEPYTFLIGTIANFYPAKDLALLIRAMARMQDGVRCIIVGDGPQRSMLERLIRDYELQHSVFLVGRIPDAARFLPAFDLFVSPSVKEGFSWAVLEAMAAKVPVVTTNVGAAPEMIQDGVSGRIVASGDAAGMANAVTALREDDRVRREMAIGAHQQVITKFLLRTMISEFERLFEKA